MALQLAINNLPQFKIYDIVVILDAGDLVEPEFLENLNAAYESAGTKAIQTHILSRNRDTTSLHAWVLSLRKSTIPFSVVDISRLVCRLV